MISLNDDFTPIASTVTVGYMIHLDGVAYLDETLPWRGDMQAGGAIHAGYFAQGGTPSILTPEDIRNIFTAIDSILDGRIGVHRITTVQTIEDVTGI